MHSDQPNHPDQPVTESADCTAMPEHHGDLRKRAYLRRQADYQLQASAANITTRQAGASAAYGRRAPS